MKHVLVAGMAKTGTTVVASVIHKSIPGSILYLEPERVAFFEKRASVGAPLIVKLIYEHWMQRPFLLSGVLRGETYFQPECSVAILRDPRDTLISTLMYFAYEKVQAGAPREQVDAWVAVLREKEADPQSHSVLGLIDEMGRIFGAPVDPNAMFDGFVDYAWWLGSNSGLCYHLKYEDFVAGDVTALAEYLEVDLSSSREVDQGLARVARTRASGSWRRMMLPEDVERWRNRYGRTLSAYGYDDWELQPQPCDPADGSAYVLRIAEEAFASRPRRAA
jgi:hypothetical protein